MDDAWARYTGSSRLDNPWHGPASKQDKPASVVLTEKSNCISKIGIEQITRKTPTSSPSTSS